MVKSGKRSLKATLSSHQTRLKKSAKASLAAKAKELSSSNSAAKSSPVTQRVVSVLPFSREDEILLIGEGNFSFTAAIFKHPKLMFIPPSNITSTAYDSEQECTSKYPDARTHIDDLRRRGVQVYFNVDATKLESCKQLKGRTWDRIVWNFPHAGSGITDQDRNILANQMLLLGFLRSASKCLAPGTIPEGTRRPRMTGRETSPSDSEDGDATGESGSDHATSRKFSKGTILITLRNVPPYTLWNLSSLAKKPPKMSSSSSDSSPVYVQLRSFTFHRSDWQGYEHRMTKGERAHGTGRTGSGGEDRTWEFCLRD